MLEAARFGNKQLALQLLDKKKGDLRADVKCKGENDWTPLHFACLNGNMDLVNLFLSHEANAEAETTLKFRPFHIAVQKGYLEIVQLFLNLGVDLNCKDIYNNTPLHYASQNGKTTFSKLIVYQRKKYKHI